ncbi:hypothetical protein GCM10023145_38600 [Angustibacter luteus]
MTTGYSVNTARPTRKGETITSTALHGERLGLPRRDRRRELPGRRSAVVDAVVEVIRPRPG